jgi:ATP-dependent Clp protease protease subunit
VRSTGKSAEQIKADIERDFYLGAPEAKEYGLIDEIFEHKPKRDGDK